MNPSPSVPYFCIPSTNICSPTVKTDVENPEIGVTNTQVTIPVADDWIVLIVTPLLLLIATIDCSKALNPFGDCITSTLEIEVPFNVASKSPVTIWSPVSGSTIIKFGAEL